MKEFDFLGSVGNGDRTVSPLFIGSGEVGGKAHSLITAEEIVEEIKGAGKYSDMAVDIPKFTVLKTDIFDTFMEMNGLYDIALSDSEDSRIAHEFQKADLPFETLKDLRDLISGSVNPLAIRSSSLLEDAKFEPFAGIYATKMLPNNQLDIDARCRKLYEAVKLVYASVFFKAPKEYLKATKHDICDEKMAVIIQEVIGRKHGERFYPDISGVARSYNFYPMGRSKPEDGVVDLAVGLGKTIVDGGLSWTYSPEDPAQSPPFGSVSEIMKNTQTEFWHIILSEPEEYDPINETEFMKLSNITEAEEDSSLGMSASTVTDSGRITPGTGTDGPRIINFAPLLNLELLPVNDMVKDLLKVCENKFNTPVEIEFAITISGEGYNAEGRFGLLQVRPMVVSDEKIEITEKEISDPDNIVTTEFALGNGMSDEVSDILFVKPDRFDAKNTKKIASEIGKFNSMLMEMNRKYILIGFGRWGSSDHWLGIPVDWGHISNVHTIIESGLPNMNVELSQGSHFFQNITLLKVIYFTVNPYLKQGSIDIEYLNSVPAVYENELLRHVRLDKDLKVKVNGMTGDGVVTV
ncbi:MAG: PEP/pyruvate-binding domain-containing protein [Candidatus Delongbacteria bacterium]